MAIPVHVIDMLEKLRARVRLRPLQERTLPGDAELTRLRPVRKANAASVSKYRDRSRNTASENNRAALADPLTMAAPEQFDANIETFIGTVKRPVGIVGPGAALRWQR